MVLQTMLTNFRDSFLCDYEVQMKQAKFQTFCEVEWPTFHVGWPTEGTLDLATIACVKDIVVEDPGHPDQTPYIDSLYILANHPLDWLRFHAPQRHTAVLVNGKVKEKKFEVHHTLEPELPDLPPYVPQVHLTAPDSLKNGSRGSQMKEDIRTEPLPMSSNGSLLITSFAFDGPRERYEPLGKVSEPWEANKQGGRNPSCGAMPPAQGSRATITLGRWVIRGKTHEIHVPALRYH
jgi:hypothetical protein